MILKHDSTANRPFQFTLSRMLRSVAYLSTALGVVTSIGRSWGPTSEPIPVMLVVWFFIGPFLALALVGASIGELRGKPWAGAARAIEAPFIFAGMVFVLAVIVLVISVVFAAIFR